MKMVKSLLLVSAAGLVAVSGAQAADLPVKAKPVEYVKVCSLYGAGFYYIPGTDICMKVGGYVRYQMNWGAGNSISAGPFNGAGGYNNRNTVTDFSQRSRAVATFDTRQQTAYGTLRTYLLMGYSQDTTAAETTAPTVYMTRGFIQIAGFTFGKATSYFDFVSTAAVAYNAGFTHSPDTGDAGKILAAYTAQFGNGVSATIAVEQSRRLATWDPFANPVFIGIGFPTVAATTGVIGALNPVSNNFGAGGLPGVSGSPDFVGNIRVDQAWGSAQVSAAAHNVSASYYNFSPGGAFTGPLETNGYPADKWGWAVSAGLRLNAPMIGPGDYFQAAFVYAEGATKYASVTPSGATNLYFTGTTYAFGLWTDGIYTGATTSGAAPFGNSIQLTTAWSVFASYEHFWTPSLRTSVYGSYVDISHNATATGILCGFPPGNIPGCNPDFRIWNIGSRSQWNVTKDLYVGLDVIYQKFETASFIGGPFVFVSPSTGTGKQTNFGYTNADQDAVSVTWRIHRDVVP